MRSKVRFAVHPLAAAGMFLLLAVCPREMTYGVLASTLCHEISHVFVGRLFSMKIKKVTVLPFGVSIEMSTPRSYAAELLVAAAGPVMNILICFIISTGIFMQSAAVGELFEFSLCLAVLNLLPVRSLDGGTVLYSLTSLVFSENTAERTLDFFSTVTLSFLWLIGVYIFFYGAENFALMAFSSFMFAFTVMKRDKSIKC